MGTPITLDELADEIERAKKTGDEDKSWVTTAEIVKRTSMSQKKVLGILRDLKDCDRLVISKRPRLTLTDKLTMVDCYQILPAAPAKRGKSR